MSFNPMQLAKKIFNNEVNGVKTVYHFVNPFDKPAPKLPPGQWVGSPKGDQQFIPYLNQYAPGQAPPVRNNIQAPRPVVRPVREKPQFSVQPQPFIPLDRSEDAEIDFNQPLLQQPQNIRSLYGLSGVLTPGLQGSPIQNVPQPQRALPQRYNYQELMNPVLKSKLRTIRSFRI